MSRLPILSAFLELFQVEVGRQIEYTFGEDPAEVGALIVGLGSDFLARVGRFSNALLNGQEWARSIVSFTGSAEPLLYYLKVDRDGADVKRATLYSRFADPVPEATLEAALSPSVMSLWKGPSPHEIGRLVETKGPWCIGLRVEADGQCGLSMYYEVDARRDDFRDRLLGPLVAGLGWPGEIAGRIAADLPAIYEPGKLGVLGLASGAGAEGLTLKLDAFDVPLRRALAYVAGKGASAARLSELASTVQRLGAGRVSYVGSKYDANGFGGWKLYVAVRPLHHAAALAPRLVSALPTGRG